MHPSFESMSENFTESISETPPNVPELPEKNVLPPKKINEIPPTVEITVVPAPKTPEIPATIIAPTTPEPDLIEFSVNKEADPVNLPESTPFKVPVTVGSKQTAAFFEQHLRVNGTPRAGGKMVTNKHNKHSHDPFAMDDQSSSRNTRRSQRNKGSLALEYPEQNITEKEAEQFIEKKGRKSGAARKQAKKAREERAKNKKIADANKGVSGQKGPAKSKNRRVVQKIKILCIQFFSRFSGFFQGLSF